MLNKQRMVPFGNPRIAIDRAITQGVAAENPIKAKLKKNQRCIS